MNQKFKYVLLFVALLLIQGVVAQTISGTVTDNYGTPVPSVNIIEKGTTNGTSTDFDGNYTITVTNSSGMLVFSSLGFLSKEIAIGGQSSINIVLEEDVEQLGEVVVTALGIKREKKALGYSVQEVSSEDITTSGDGNVTTALQGKVAGVNITTTGGIGGNSRIELRGNSSLADNNDVLWVVDGVPFSSGDTSDGDIWGGVSNGGGLLDINPEDIQSMSVLKGGSAAALYGSRGANGVIVITTKKGSESQGLGISYTGSVVASSAAYFLDLQEEFGQGSEGVYDKFGTSSWGPQFDGGLRESWTGEMLPYLAAKDRLKDFTRTGVTSRHSVSLSNGGEKGSYRATISKDWTEGIYANHEINKTNFDLNATYSVNPWLNVDAKVSYINTKGQQRPEIGFYSVVSYFNSMPMNIRLQDLRPGYEIVGGEHVETLYTTANASYRNPYFLREQTVNNDERNRFFGNFTANIDFNENLKLRLRYGLDNYRYETENGYRYGDNVSDLRPNYITAEKFFSEENMELLLSYNKDLNEDFNLGVSAGANKMYRDTDKLSAESGKLISEETYFLSGAEDSGTIKTTEEFTEREIQSVYGFVDLSYKNYLFLNATARNDWSSTLPEDNNSYFYPSVNLSALVSEMVEMPDWVTYFKVRGSWAQVGKDTDPYNTSQVYTLGSGNFNLTTTSEPDLLVNSDLKPEISTSSEVGAELKLFKGILGIDFTYYSEDTKNQIVIVDLDQSTGYKGRYDNLGLITNRGIELMTTITPIRKDDFRLDITLNYAKNKGIVEELVTSVDDDEFYTFIEDNGGVQVRGTEGEKMGDIFGYAYERSEDGQIIIDDDGLPVRAGERQVLGNIQPDFTGSIGLNVSYKDFFLSALFGMQEGGEIYSLTEAGATGSGNASRTAQNNRMAFFPEGIKADGTSPTQIVSAQDYWSRVSGITEEFIYDASYMKLNEISIGYNIPLSLLGNKGSNFIREARISLIGRDLFYLYKDTPGTVPDASSYSTSYGARAFDFSPVPVTRSVGCSVNLKF
ncbi:SusC/RagA family TonB-linked outer membrane protein [Maribacter polysiphoniae]|uniref:SusC/RagA family TonB-linked outer membrane protein n=1 Tax=Maribacter polysiphoniae TaxID=429344 RepID=A0A316E436_9FLAO|nr:SusC/RagA family TonB-linked outer membrane protein [Maribacter polysiphoniae]MBD1259276.1 SusC/RagA family TonB-linked outer membrane protein [Maribacter polysiphoniae]PWK24836.1 TonB-linked SusC/RagA family outer membrane protein [Maribacter polysiphoniae]